MKRPNTATLIAVGAVAAVLLVFFTGIIASIAVPNLLHAIDRGKQKRTMADLQSIGRAIEEFAIDHNEYPTANTPEDLLEAVRDYLEAVPTTDGWGHTFVVKCEPRRYALCSPGKDGGDCDVTGEGGATESFNDSIIFADGQFVQYPEGPQF